MIAAILFDKDGTLYDFYHTWGALTEKAALMVADGDAERARFLLENSGKDPVTGKFAPSSPIAAGSNREIVEVWCGLIQRADVEAVYERVHVMFLEHQKNGADPVLDLNVFFGRLKGRGLRLGLATMDSEEAARAAMLRAKATHHLDFICGFDTGHGVKPLGGMVEAFALAVGVPVSALAVVGDSPHDMHMARAGKAARAIGVLTGVSPREALLEAGAHEVIESIAELESVL
ncbi:MAG TPA: HAD family hydrolase [Dongiaceae bacterium]|jgi:phosphoglycolate phosphatase|nr:HAD family hydrolase [Dongiaceae bacterium]